MSNPANEMGAPAPGGFAPPPAPMGAPMAPAGTLQGQRRVGKIRSPWGVWWLSYLTCGIYFLVWYAKINRELMEFAPEAVQVKPGLAVLAQFFPIIGWVSLSHTAGRINAAHAAVGAQGTASGGMAILSSLWIGSQTRYLQRRINHLWDPTNPMSK